MSRPEHQVTISREDLLRALRHISMIVVSSDRIGSCIGDHSKADVEDMFLHFVDDWDVFARLAEVRKLLSEPFSTELGEDDMDELERELDDLIYWRFDARTPLDKSV